MTGKKAAAGGEHDDVADLEAELDGELSKDFTFEEAEKKADAKAEKAAASTTAAPTTAAPPAKKAPPVPAPAKPAKGKAEEDWVGRRVGFDDPELGRIEGDVTTQVGRVLTVDAGEEHENFYEIDYGEVERLPDAADVKGKPGPVAPAVDKKAAAAEAAEIPPETRMLLISEVEIPKVLARKSPDPEDEKFKRFVADIKDRRQTTPIRVTSFEKPVLVEGLRRIAALNVLGVERIWATIATIGDKDSKVLDDEDRLWHAALDNEQREAMHWLDLARVFFRLLKSEKYTQRRIARAFGIGESEVSRMTAAVKLPEEILEVAKTTDKYSPSVYLELTAAPEKVQTAVLAHMKAGSPLVADDVRDEKKKAKAAEPQKTKAGEPDRRGGARERPEPASLSYRDISLEDLGPGVRVRVYGDRLEWKVTTPHEQKTFRGFDTMKAIKQAFSDAFSTEGVRVNSHEGLLRALNSAKAELA